MLTAVMCVGSHATPYITTQVRVRDGLQPHSSQRNNFQSFIYKLTEKASLVLETTLESYDFGCHFSFSPTLQGYRNVQLKQRDLPAVGRRLWPPAFSNTHSSVDGAVVLVNFLRDNLDLYFWIFLPPWLYRGLSLMPFIIKPITQQDFLLLSLQSSNSSTLNPEEPLRPV